MALSSAMSIAVPSSPSRLSPVVASGIVYALQFFAVGIFIAYATVYLQGLGIDLATIGLMAAIPAAVGVVAGPAWGIIADRIGDIRGPYLAASLVAAAAALAMALVPAMPWLVLSVAAISLGNAGQTPLLDARTVQRLAPNRDRFGLARVWGSASFMVSTVAVGILIGATGITAAWPLCAAFLVAAGVAAFLLLGRTDPGLTVASPGPRAALGLLREPSMGLFFVGSTVAWISSACALTLFSLRITELGGGTDLVGLGWAVNAAFELPMMLGFRALARRVPVARLIVAGVVVFALRAALWSVAGTPQLFVLVAALGGIGFALVLVGTTVLVGQRVPASLQATAQALFTGTTFAIGSIVGALVAGAVAQAAGIAAVYPVAAVASVVAAVAVWAAIARPGAMPATAGGDRTPPVVEAADPGALAPAAPEPAEPEPEPVS